MPQPDLFVVCKNCGSEVSPYVTECPYCGQRVRKRAPKLDKGAPGEPKEARRRRPRLPRLRSDEIEGIAPDTRPYATLTLIAAALAMTFVYVADKGLDTGWVVPGIFDEPWRWAVAPFIHQDALGYAFVTMIATGIFGTLLERRFGPVRVLLIFLASGFAGCALAVQLEIEPLFSNQATVVIGANGASLGLLAAWYVDDRRAARRGDDRENDLLGVYVIAAVLLLLSVAVEEANIAAAVGGAAAGAILGLALPLFTKR
jgi:membrane associated rhomboid family serine protease